jgi:ankyrin repeat protein
MLIRQRTYRGLIGALLAAVVAGPGSGAASAQETPTAKLRVLSESLEAADIAEIRALIKAGADVNVKNKYGVSPLMIAAANGHTEIVTALLEANADVNAAHTDGSTPLWVAAANGHTEIVTALLAAEAGAGGQHDRRSAVGRLGLRQQVAELVVGQ